MGYCFGVSLCFMCTRPFTYNPNFVPSIRSQKGIREPVCGGCMAIVNAKRVEMGLEAHTIHPEAYEPLNEAEL